MLGFRGRYAGPPCRSHIDRIIKQKRLAMPAVHFQSANYDARIHLFLCINQNIQVHIFIKIYNICTYLSKYSPYACCTLSERKL
jgi:hypothetical protein